MKFTIDGGITVSFEQRSDVLLCRIKDTGPGIPSDHLVHIFERFYQGEHDSSRPQPGGLGLAISQKIIELHNGCIEVTSIEGQGSAFSFSLPVDQKGDGVE